MRSKNIFYIFSLLKNTLILKRTKDILTEINPETKKAENKVNKPILMISSTSWTPDEDFTMLFNSFVNIEKMFSHKKNENTIIRKVLFLITGRGPQKDYFMKQIEKRNFKYFIIKSIWLESDDYPKILGCADLGVCLHYSSSGFDLPMKVVDMFSAQLPVCAVYYPTIEELVIENKNGFLFKNEKELSDLLGNLIQELSLKAEDSQIKNSSSFIKHMKLNQYSLNLKEFGEYDWITQWREKAKDDILRLIEDDEKINKYMKKIY